MICQQGLDDSRNTLIVLESVPRKGRQDTAYSLSVQKLILHSSP